MKENELIWQNCLSISSHTIFSDALRKITLTFLEQSGFCRAFTGDALEAVPLGFQNESIGIKMTTSKGSTCNATATNGQRNRKTNNAISMQMLFKVECNLTTVLTFKWTQGTIQ